MITVADIRERLAEIRPPGAKGDIASLGAVRNIRLDGGRVRIDLALPGLAAGLVQATVADIRRAVGALEGVTEVAVQLEGQGASTASPFGDLGPLPGVADIVAVASTKGGVGKSTVAVNLACALARIGRRAGLLDADVYGPSLPIMMGITARPRVAEGAKIQPLEKYGVKLMSMGFFLDDDTPVIWRGPLVTGLIRQFLKDVLWGETDVLVIDLPPGTGDAALTLVQQVPLSGGVIVTTPQAVSLLDVARGVAMFQQVNTPVLGVVESMSYYECPSCHTREDVFGSGGGARLAQECGVPLLAEIPLFAEVRAGGDAGKPIVIDQPEHPASRIFTELARRVVEAVVRARAAAPAIVG
jgi:ATP-binding protein involved in chromosome partitioning